MDILRNNNPTYISVFEQVQSFQGFLNILREIVYQ